MTAQVCSSFGEQLVFFLCGGEGAVSSVAFLGGGEEFCGTDSKFFLELSDGAFGIGETGAEGKVFGG